MVRPGLSVPDPWPRNSGGVMTDARES